MRSGRCVRLLQCGAALSAVRPGCSGHDPIGRIVHPGRWADRPWHCWLSEYGRRASLERGRHGQSTQLPTVVVAIAYFLAARLSLFLLAEPDGVAVFWPAAGVASGILIGAGSVARWPVVLGVMAATLVANLLGDRNLWTSICSAVANAGEAVVIAGLVERIHGSPFELNRLQRVVGLFAAAVAATMLSGIVGTLGFRVVSQLNRIHPDHLASLVYLQRTWHRHCCATRRQGLLRCYVSFHHVANWRREP